jgi:hypothetical protein
VHVATNMSVVRLSARRWAMEIRPDRGGRITSLRLDGEELLDQGIGVDQPTANGFVEGGAFGWDEMVPNLEPTDTLPDHGEAWRLPWTVVAASDVSVGMSCQGRLAPWKLGRRIFLGEGVEVLYSYINTGTEAQPGYWCAHPLFKLEADMEAGLPLPEEGMSRKVFLPSGSAYRHALRWRSGAAIAMSWDSFETPDVAVWLCNGDLGGYRQVAIEPSWTRPAMAPGETYSWWLRIDHL